MGVAEHGGKGDKIIPKLLMLFAIGNDGFSWAPQADRIGDSQEVYF